MEARERDLLVAVLVLGALRELRRAAQAHDGVQDAPGCDALAPLHERPGLRVAAVRELGAGAPVAQGAALADPQWAHA
eukprot:4365192-Alexandrium_andersonii.AAC.1